MKPRAWRITIAAAALGTVLVAVLALANWGIVRDHVEAWRFQLTRETETIQPVTEGVIVDSYSYRREGLLHVGARQLGRPVIFDPADIPNLERMRRVWAYEPDMKALFEMKGWRVLEQGLPRRAHVVIRDAHQAQLSSALKREELVSKR